MECFQTTKDAVSVGWQGEATAVLHTGHSLYDPVRLQRNHNECLATSGVTKDSSVHSIEAAVQ